MTSKKDQEAQAEADREAGIQRDENGDPTPNPDGFTDPTKITLEPGIPNPNDEQKPEPNPQP